LVLSVHRFLM